MIETDISISVLLPVFNGEKYLNACIQSVLTQSRSDFEFLIGDDASSDSTARILATYNDPRIRIIRHEQNLGLFKNLNALLGQARGPVVRFLCQDDALERECIDDELSFFNKNPDVGLTFCKTTRIDEQDKIIDMCELNDLPSVISPRLATQLLYYFGCLPGNLSTVCVRRECLQTAGMFDASFGAAADYELWSRICRRYPLGVVHKRLLKLRQHRNQLSHRSDSAIEHIRGTRLVRAALLKNISPKILRNAKRYAILRHDALNAHHVVVSAVRGHFHHAFRALRAIGFEHAMFGIMSWLFTINNRIYRPKASLDLDGLADSSSFITRADG